MGGVAWKWCGGVGAVLLWKRGKRDRNRNRRMTGGVGGNEEAKAACDRTSFTAMQEIRIFR